MVLNRAKEEVLSILEEIDSHRKLEVTEKKMIESVITFRHRIVRELMLPRVDIFILSHEMTIQEAALKIQKEQYSRIPIYEDSIDNIIGVLLYRDLLRIYTESESIKGKKDMLDRPIRSLMKPVLYTPETKLISVLLQEFKKKQLHLAIVVDEYGGTSGMITIEDILEEIVGDIEDEYDRDEDLPFIQKVPDGWIIDAKLNLLDLEKNCGIVLTQQADYDTVGGYIFQKIGMIPTKGSKIHLDHFTLEVIQVDERSIKRIHIKLDPAKELF